MPAYRKFQDSKLLRHMHIKCMHRIQKSKTDLGKLVVDFPCQSKSISPGILSWTADNTAYFVYLICFTARIIMNRRIAIN